MVLSGEDYPQPDLKSGKVEYKTIEKLVPQYLFGLGGSYKVKKLVDYIEGAEARMGVIRNKAKQLASYDLGGAEVDK